MAGDDAGLRRASTQVHFRIAGGNGTETLSADTRSSRGELGEPTLQVTATASPSTRRADDDFRIKRLGFGARSTAQRRRGPGRGGTCAARADGLVRAAPR